MDKIDHFLLREVYKSNSDKSHKQISQDLSISQPAVSYRIRKLEEKGLISYHKGLIFNIQNTPLAIIEVSSMNPDFFEKKTDFCPFVFNILKENGKFNQSIYLTALNLTDLKFIIDFCYYRDITLKKIEISLIENIQKEFFMPINFQIEKISDIFLFCRNCMFNPEKIGTSQHIFEYEKNNPSNESFSENKRDIGYGKNFLLQLTYQNTYDNQSYKIGLNYLIKFIKSIKQYLKCDLVGFIDYKLEYSKVFQYWKGRDYYNNNIFNYIFNSFPIKIELKNSGVSPISVFQLLKWSNDRIILSDMIDSDTLPSFFFRKEKKNKIQFSVIIPYSHFALIPLKTGYFGHDCFLLLFSGKNMFKKSTLTILEEYVKIFHHIIKKN